ncbi:MAG TPA: HD domain-containing protein [Pyrinomonadaceae bacterium]|nr:HD domain-containing protein [Pyrinomonadaceae bacterium]
MRTSHERVYRDAVHNIIRLRTDTDEGRLIGSLVDSAEFQRLRRIRQLGLAHFAYQAAEHSRFAHSLGAFHLASRTLAKLRLDHTISEEDQMAVRVAALLHDTGHGPFSHVIEPILKFHHEDFTVEALLSPDTDVGRLLTAHSPELPERVAAIIRGTFRPMALAQLVSSQLDVDRMDYLLRDSLMTGVKYGVYDLEWIIKSLEINEAADQLYVSARGVYAVEDYLQARYYMFRQVYYHRTLRAAESILHSILRRALHLYEESGDVWFQPDSAFEKVLQGAKLSLSEHLSLDDSDFLYHIKQWRNSADRILADLSSRFLDRRLFKAFDLDMTDDRKQDFIDESRKVVEQAGFDPDYYFIEDKAGDAPHYFYIRDETKPKDQIYVEDGFSAPVIREISEVSAPVRGLQAGYRIHRICFPAEVKEVVTRFYHA